MATESDFEAGSVGHGSIMAVTGKYIPAGIVRWGEGYLPGALIGWEGIIHYTNDSLGPVIDGHWATKEEWEAYLDE